MTRKELKRELKKRLLKFEGLELTAEIMNLISLEVSRFVEEYGIIIVEREPGKVQ